MQQVIFLMGVSGAGKSTIMQELLLRDPSLVYVPSYTTRTPRAGELEGHPYHFITHAEFEAKLEADDWLEYAFVHQMNYYGTSRASIQAVLDADGTPIKEADMYGLRYIIEHETLPLEQLKTIFIDISDELIVERIHKRGGADMDDINKRLASTHEEREGAMELCDYMIDGAGDVETVVERVFDAIRTPKQL